MQKNFAKAFKPHYTAKTRMRNKNKIQKSFSKIANGEKETLWPLSWLIKWDKLVLRLVLGNLNLNFSSSIHFSKGTAKSTFRFETLRLQFKKTKKLKMNSLKASILASWDSYLILSNLKFQNSTCLRKRCFLEPKSKS